ncbi:hypothetical protein JTE90_006149 [Oedothorax gibbosus]|uniref:Uncharacterized protein n=1 Tax=Oedothorax gibbosus TaxID=931172 RepID=A0AAV6TTS9_9ARAC|nr:hypothetical protein JTE90_006149 [Oedothorax gibbosus]
MYLACEQPLETGKASRLKEVYYLGGPKIQKITPEMFTELTGLTINSPEEFWSKGSREVCAKNTRDEMKNIFREVMQIMASWWSNWCESKDPSDRIECDACAKGAPHLLQLLTEVKAQGKCGKTVPTSLPKMVPTSLPKFG